MIHIKTRVKDGITVEQLNKALPYVSAIVKQVLGVANNFAQVQMFNARDDIKQHPQHRHAIKKAFNEAFKAWEDYEKRLLNPVGVRYFHVEDMPPKVRKQYGTITDREYYEYWQNVGWSVYSKNRAFVTMMDNKFKLSLQKHGVAHAELLCKAMTAEQLLNIAEQRYKDALGVVKKEIGLSYDNLNVLYGDFSLKGVHDRWAKAMTMLIPNFPLDEVEDRNLRMSVEQLYEIVSDIPEMYNGIEKSTEDYEDIFRTKGEWKKALRKMREETNETIDLLSL